MGDVQPFQVLSDDNDVHIFEASVLHQSASRPDIGIELQFLAQPHIHGTETSTNRRRQRTFQRQSSVADAIKRSARKSVAMNFQGCHPTLLAVPGKGTS